MATAFETQMLETARRLIAKRGRQVVLEAKVASSYDDADKPWRGKVDRSQKVMVNAVILPVGEGDSFDAGQMVQSGDETGYVEGSTCPKLNVGDVLDGRTIMAVKTWRPGSESILYEVLLRR